MKLAYGIFRVFLVVFILWGLGGTALAAGGDNGGSGFSIPNPLNCGDDPANPGLAGCVSNVIKDLLILAVPITTVMVVIGGFQILTAGGDPEKFKKGRKTIIYAAAGFAVILLAEGVVYIVQDVLNGGGGCAGGSCANAICSGSPPLAPCLDGSQYQCVNGSWSCP